MILSAMSFRWLIGLLAFGGLCGSVVGGCAEDTHGVTAPVGGAAGEAGPDSDGDVGTDTDAPSYEAGEDAPDDGATEADARPDGQVDCPAGLQDNDGDGECLPDCETAGLVCVGHARCDDGQGWVRCVCDPGYQDKDEDGSCRASCATAALDCGSDSHCDDEGGTAVCVCDDGYQDHDHDGACLAACETAGDVCGAHGVCDDGGGWATCDCEVGHTGDDCSACEIGYQDHDGDGTCLFNCDLANLVCPSHGHCEDGSGVPVCACDVGHAGDGCRACEAGYQDHDQDGACLPDCATAGEVCVGPGTCDDVGGEAVCACDVGFQDRDDDGTCLPECATAALGCSSGQECEDWSGVATCACPRGYAGESCALCAEGFVLESGSCRPDRAWSVIVYMSADNDLESAAFANLAQMMQVGSGPEVHVVVLIDTFSEGGRALYVEEGSHSTVATFGEPDMGDWRTLRDMGAWAVRKYPAERYALVLWDHGRGWSSQGALGTPPLLKGFSEDVHGSAGAISVAGGELGRALLGISSAIGGAPLDLVGFDACLMGMWEVAASVAPYADVLVASSENVPSSGWPYDAVLAALDAEPGMGPEALGARIVEAYHGASAANATLGAVDLPAVAALGGEVNALANALSANPGWFGVVESARLQTQGFGDPRFKDFRDFVDHLAASPGAPVGVVDAAVALSQGLEAAVLQHAAQSSHPGARGLSVYLPPRAGGMDCAYRDTAAGWRATGWADFLSAFGEAACGP